jgi:hypothetical protein
MVQRRNLFQDSNFPKSYLPQIRGSSWQNKREDCYGKGLRAHRGANLLAVTPGAVAGKSPRQMCD